MLYTYLIQHWWETHSVFVLGAGFIGSAVTAALLHAGHRVTVLTRSQPTGRRAELLEGAHVLIGPADTAEALANACVPMDEVIYALGSSTPVESELAPASDIAEVLPPLVRVLETLKHHPRTRLIFLSSGGTVYGNVDALPISEHAPTKPISSYGILKLACEQYIAMYTQVHGVRANVLRVANPYGPEQDWQRGQGLIARMLHCARTDSPLTLFNWGRPIRDYIFIDDLASAITRCISADQLPAVMNVGSGVGHSSKEVAALMREATGTVFEIKLEPGRGYDVSANVLDVALMSRTLGVEPRSLWDGLIATVPIAALSPQERPVPNAALRTRSA